MRNGVIIIINPINIQKVELLSDKIEPENLVMKIRDIPEYDYMDYDIHDDKDFKKFIQDVEKEVRGSFEYREMLKYLRLYMHMGESANFSDINNNESTKIKIELHHYPFSLYDICVIIINKRMFYKESMELQLVAKEVMMTHYKLLVGLIPLTQTEHELYHNGLFFIDATKVLGRYDLFIDYYKEFMTQEQLDAIDAIEEHSKIHDYREEEALLNRVNISLDSSVSYNLPDFSMLKNGMSNRIEEIKQNEYMLPYIEKKDINPTMLTEKPKVKAFEIKEDWKMPGIFFT